MESSISRTLHITPPSLPSPRLFWLCPVATRCAHTADTSRIDLTEPTAFQGPRKLLKEGTVHKAKSGRKLWMVLCTDVLILTEDKNLYRMVSPAWALRRQKGSVHIWQARRGFATNLPTLPNAYALISAYAFISASVDEADPSPSPCTASTCNKATTTCRSPSSSPVGDRARTLCASKRYRTRSVSTGSAT